MKASSILTPVDSTGEFSRRQVLPLSAAVQGPRFRRRDWALSAQVREILDEINLPMAPRPVADAPCESIIMEGAEIRRTMRTGSHVVRQNSTAAIELDDTPAPLAFEVVADTSIQTAAAAALAQINARHSRTTRRPIARPAPSASTHTLWIAFAIAAGVVAMLIKVVVTGVLL